MRLEFQAFPQGLSGFGRKPEGSLCIRIQPTATACSSDSSERPFWQTSRNQRYQQNQNDELFEHKMMKLEDLQPGILQSGLH